MGNCVITDLTAPSNDRNRVVHAEEYEHGISFQASDSENRNHRVLYPKSQRDANFGVTLKFASYRDFEDFGQWVMRYARRASDPDNVPVAMQVWIPVREFSRSGVPQGVNFGRKVGDVTWTMSLAFVGVQDPLSYSSPLLSRFKAIGAGTNHPLQDASGADVGKYFYPAGTQLSEEDRLAVAASKAAEEAKYAPPLIPKRGAF